MKSIKNYIFEHIKTPDTTKAFVIIKPGFLSHVDEIYDYIKDKGFECYDHTETMNLGEGQCKELYKMHKDKEFYDDLVKYMQGDIQASIWGYEGEDDPIEVMNKIKDHFRNKYSKDDMKNVMHSSDSLRNVKREANIIFN